MKASFQICDPDEVMAKVTVTMSVGQWRELRDQMPRAWPSWKFAEVISEAIRQAEQAFYAEERTDG